MGNFVTDQCRFGSRKEPQRTQLVPAVVAAGANRNSLPGGVCTEVALDRFVTLLPFFAASTPLNVAATSFVSV